MISIASVFEYGDDVVPKGEADKGHGATCCQRGEEEFEKGPGAVMRLYDAC